MTLILVLKQVWLNLNLSNLFNKNNLIWQSRPLTLPNVTEWSWNWTTIPLPSFLGHEHFLTETGFYSSHNKAKVFKLAALLQSKRSFLYQKQLSMSLFAAKLLGSWAFFDEKCSHNKAKVLLLSCGVSRASTIQNSCPLQLVFEFIMAFTLLWKLVSLHSQPACLLEACLPLF